MEIFLETFFLEYRTKYLAKSLEEFEEVKLIPVRIPKQIPEKIPEETVGKISEKKSWKYLSLTSRRKKSKQYSNKFLHDFVPSKNFLGKLK